MAPVEFAPTDTEAALMMEPMPQQQPRGHRGFVVVVAAVCVGAFVIGRASVSGVVTQAAVDGSTQLQVTEDGNSSGNISGNASEPAPGPPQGPPGFVASGGDAIPKGSDVCPGNNGGGPGATGTACVYINGKLSVLTAEKDQCINRGGDGAGEFKLGKNVTGVATNGDVRITWYQMSDCQTYQNLQANLGSCSMCAADQSINLPNDRFFWLKNAESFMIHSCPRPAFGEDPPCTTFPPSDPQHGEYDHKNVGIPEHQVRNPATGQMQIME